MTDDVKKICGFCEREFTEHGGLMIGIPEPPERTKTDMFHVCPNCYEGFNPVAIKNLFNELQETLNGMEFETPRKALYYKIEGRVLLLLNLLGKL